MQLLKLFGLMFGIGMVTFGGGYAIIGVLQSYMVDKLHWVTLSQFTSGIVVGEVTPGPLSAMAAYVGYKMAGVPGGIAASLGLLLFPFLASVLVARAYERFRQVTWVRSAIKGVSLAVVALLGGALLSMIRGSILTATGALPVDLWAVLIAAATFVATGPFKKDPLWPFLGAALLGMLLYR